MPSASTPAPPASLKSRAGWRSADGNSRLVPGDHLDLLATLDSDSVDCIWTDPPYFLSNGSTTCQAGKRVAVHKGAWDESQGMAADHAFNQRWLAACKRVLKPNGTLWVSGTHHVYLSVGMAMMELGLRILNDIVWEKPNPPPNLGCRCFTHATEMVLWATKARKGSKDRYTFNYEAMKSTNGDRQMKNVWRFKAPGKTEKQHGKHPTQKPLALIERCLLASTQAGDIVLDPFAGSGSTGVAALMHGRHFIGAEIDDEHCKLAVNRLKAADKARDKIA